MGGKSNANCERWCLYVYRLESSGDAHGDCIATMLRQNVNIKIRAFAVAVVILGVHALPWVSSACAQSTFTHEYRIKAAFLYEFANFIDGWKFQQKESDEKANSPVFLGVIGDDPFKDAFKPLKAKKIRGRKVVIKYFKGLSHLNSEGKKVKLHPDIKTIKKCDLIFVCSSEKQYIGDILGPIRNQRILTVGDTQGFLEKGIIVNFIIEKRKVRFEINTAGAYRAKLKIRSKLLRLAKRVITADDVERQ
jgi:hypothetical protein